SCHALSLYSSVRVRLLCSLPLLMYSLTILIPLSSPLFPYTTLFRSPQAGRQRQARRGRRVHPFHLPAGLLPAGQVPPDLRGHRRSEEHTSELQSRFDLVCRLLLEKKKKNKKITSIYHEVL